MVSVVVQERGEKGSKTVREGFNLGQQEGRLYLRDQKAR